jgi:hypothetical protein
MELGLFSGYRGGGRRVKVKKYDYLINENGDVWFVDSAHKDGSVTIVYLEGGTGEDELTYSAGEIEAWFRKLPAGRDYSDVSYLDPAPYWGKVEEQTKQFHALRRKGAGTKRKTAKSRQVSSSTSLRGLRR